MRVGRTRLPGSLASAAAAACLLAGCGTSDRDAVRSKVEEFAVAIAHKDARTICSDVFAPSLVAHFEAAGLSCVRGMGIFFSGVREPTLAVGPITVHGAKASVVTLSGASGQTAAVRTINLVNTAAGWRIVSLGGSAVSAGGGGGSAPTAPRRHSPQKKH